MDFYLQANNSYDRLEEEFKKYGKLIFCVDFDDTIYDFHKKGRTYKNVISLLQRWENYSEVIIFTGNGEDKYEMIEEYLNDNHIKHRVLIVMHLLHFQEERFMQMLILTTEVD